MQFRRIISVALCGTSATLAACTASSREDVSPTRVESTLSLTEMSAANTSTVDTLAAPASSAVASTSLVPTSRVGRTTSVGLTATECVVPGPLTADESQITFVSGGRVLAVPGNLTRPAASDTPTCLYELQPAGIKQLDWSPDGSALLLGSDQVARGTKLSASGYLPTNPDVKWSGPNGKSLLATTAKGELVKRNSTTGARTDISFLPKHQSSVYHPAGKAIISIGEFRDSDYEPDARAAAEGSPQIGVFLATNTGSEPRLLISDDSDAALSEVAFSGSGRNLYFIAQHVDKFHLHRYETNVGGLFEEVTSTTVISNLVASEVDESVAVQVGACDANTPPDLKVWTGPESSQIEFQSLRDVVPQVPDGALFPVGWLPGKRLVVIARTGCTGPGNLSVVDITAGTVQIIANNVSMAATRTRHVIPEELAIPLNDEVEA